MSTSVTSGSELEPRVLSPRAGDRAVARVVALAVALTAAAVWLVVRAPSAFEPVRSVPWWFVAVVAIGYAVAEASVFHVEYRREAITFSVSEVPTAFALVFLGPVPAITARIIGSMLVVLRTYRPPPFKLFFNAALFAFEVALAFTLLNGMVGREMPGDAVLLIAVAASAALATQVSSLCVAGAISVFEGGFVKRVIDEVRLGVVVGAIAATVAAVAVAPALISLELAVLGIVPVASVWLVLLRHGRLTQRHRDLEEIHDFAGSVGRTLRIDEIATTALDAALELVRGQRGALQVYAPDGSLTVEHHVGDERLATPYDAADARWHPVFEASGAVGYRELPGRGVRLDPGERFGRLAVPVRDGNGLLGLILISGRVGVTDLFDADDVRRAARVGDQLAAHLRNAALHADIEHTATHDSLTGDHNRRAFDEIVTNALAAPPSGSRRVGAVLMLDLDRFKEVNDTFGHQTGDMLLIEFARRVRSLLDDGDVLARFGGDEFALFVRRHDRNEILDLADRIVASAHEALPLGGHDVVVAVSAGVALVGPDDDDSTSVLRRADIAMYFAKSSHAGYEVYRPEIDRRTPQRLAILGDLRDALDDGHLDVHYQPVIDITTSTVVGAEALVRWKHSARGWINPIEFIPVAEESGLIRQLTDQVLTAAIETVAGWRRKGYDLSVSANLSALDLVDERLAERIERRLLEHDLGCDALMLEITESSLMADTPRTMATIDQLNELGLRLSLDDFGTGYSSLSYLRRLPVAELKIDRSFVSNVLLDPQDAAIVRSTVDLGHNLGLQVVAEGIENGPMFEYLRSLGCDLGQGYSISRELPSHLFERWLETTEYDVPRLGDDGVVTELRPTRLA